MSAIADWWISLGWSVGDYLHCGYGHLYVVKKTWYACGCNGKC